MSLYLDASVLVPLFTEDPFSVAATDFIRRQRQGLVVSDFACAEFASAVSRLVRIAGLTRNHARQAFVNFDEWIAVNAERVAIEAADVAEASASLRRLDTSLRAPDAIHIAIARRLDAALFTFDRKLAESARKLGVTLASA